MPVFKEKREKARMLNLIRDNSTKYDVEIYAYCIMPNHFHMLIKADLKELASFMASVLAEFAKYYNQKHNRVGYVFQGRYRSQCIEDIGYFWNCLRYIHNNALYITDVDAITNYEYSSMREFYLGEIDILSEIVFQLVESRFENINNFFEFHRKGSWNSFDDIEEELMDNKIRIARELLFEYERDLEIPSIEILDYFKTRHMYQTALISLLHIPARESREIMQVLRKELKGTG